MRMSDILKESHTHTIKSSEYPKTLQDERDIAEYIDSMATAYVDVEAMENYFEGASATLQLADIDSISEGDSDHNIRSAKKEDKYSKMSIDTIPPIVVENGKVMDGNHRLRVMRKLGLKKVWAYVVH